MYNKWKALPEFQDVLMTIDKNHHTTFTTTDHSASEGVSDDECRNGDDGSNQSVDETSIKNESMEDDYDSDEIMDA